VTAFYDDMQETAGELLAEFGQSVTITKPGAGTYDNATGVNTPAASTTQTGLAIEEAYKAHEIDGTLVKVGDKKLMLSPLNAAGAVLTAPLVGHSVTVGGVVYRIMSVEPYSPGGTVLYIILQLRRS
jgi:hypothetical protein